MAPVNDISRRWFNSGGFLLCAGLLGYGYYLQYFSGLEPCPLCILQRLAFVALGITLLVAGVHNAERTGSRVYAVLIAAIALTGAGIAGRHAWLQYFPPDVVPECGGGLEYMLELLPLTEVIKTVFSGAGDCTEISWSFLALSMPVWACIWFVILGVSGLTINWSTTNERPFTLFR